MKTLAAAGIIAAGLGLGAAWDALNDGPVACDMDGDGRFFFQQENGDITGPARGGWRLSNDGSQCFAGGGSSEPVILDRKDLVDHAGIALRR